METATPGYKNRWKALFFIAISLLVISLDNTILNVALPSIAINLGATASDLQWIVDAYVLVFASLLLTMGAISDRIGRKRALQFGLVMFAIGSVAAALSQTTGALIASRAFLGIGGATIMPSTLSILTATFPAEERPQAIAIWAGIFGLGIGIGPLIGGLLLEQFTWSAVFFINIPVITIALIGGYFTIAESKDDSAPRPDIPGVLLSITGLFSLVYAIIEAGFRGWDDSTVLAAFAIAAVLLTIFAWWESHNPNAMLPLRFFRNMSFTGANVALILVMFSMFGAMFFMSQYLQSVLGFTALETGVRLLPMAVTSLIVAASSARVAERFGTKLTVAVGIFITGCAMFYFSQVATVTTEYGTLLTGFIAFSTGMGLVMSPATNSIMQSLPVSKAGVGSAMNDTTRQIGGALGVAVLGTIMNNTYLSQITTLTENPLLASLTIPGTDQAVTEIISSSVQAAHIVADNIPLAPMAEQIRTVANEAFVAGMIDALLVGTVVMMISALLTVIILPARVRAYDEPQPQSTPPDNIIAHSPAGD